MHFEVLAEDQSGSIALDVLLQKILGTWEILADAVHPGGSAQLKKAGWPAPGAAKFDWASKITPHVEVDRNLSSSFQVFRNGVRNLAGT